MLQELLQDGYTPEQLEAQRRAVAAQMEQLRKVAEGKE